MTRRKKVSTQESDPGERPDDREQIEPAEQQDQLLYTSVFSKSQPIYSNIGPAQRGRHKKEKKEDREMVEYAAVTFISAGTAPRSRHQEPPEDPAAVYSLVNKPSRKQ
ncbi:B-cell receptor CD22-like [Lates japonicus]|nr:B-cell receptor CD22-like protein [Lates japonicus]GLD62930.1 B-cell receptor CD22-like protein [Lates japonicus]